MVQHLSLLLCCVYCPHTLILLGRTAASGPETLASRADGRTSSARNPLRSVSLRLEVEVEAETGAEAPPSTHGLLISDSAVVDENNITALGTMVATDTPPGNTPRPTCTLCYYPFSVYSILVRLAFLLGQQSSPDRAPLLETRLVNLQIDENLEEEYLSMNSKGQVSTALFHSHLLSCCFILTCLKCFHLDDLHGPWDKEEAVHSACMLMMATQVPSLILSSDITLKDSFDISNWLCDQQPELLPAECREGTLTLIREFYSFHARALTAYPDDSKDGFPNRAAAKLEQSGISESHRRQLEIKSVL